MQLKKLEAYVKLECISANESPPGSKSIHGLLQEL